jgi:hypothetical protein
MVRRKHRCPFGAGAVMRHFEFGVRVLVRGHMKWHKNLRRAYGGRVSSVEPSCLRWLQTNASLAPPFRREPMLGECRQLQYARSGNPGEYYANSVYKVSTATTSD